MRWPRQRRRRRQCCLKRYLDPPLERYLYPQEEELLPQAVP